MNLSRREFVKLSGAAGVGAIGVGGLSIAVGAPENEEASKFGNVRAAGNRPHVQRVNLNGFAAPRLDTVRVGFIGIGNRGTAAVKRVAQIEGVEVRALCDLVPDRVDRSKAWLLEHFGSEPAGYSGEEDSWMALCEQDDIDLVYICTPWALHTPNAIHSMEQGKHVAVEVPAATTVEDCWRLVETAEGTGRHCMMLENCCYDFFELLTLHLARNGYFGEIIHGEGAYIHDRLEKVFTNHPWRLRENFRNGNLYPTHGLGPICEIMDLNCGDQMDYLVSVASNDFMMGAKAAELAQTDPRYQEYVDRDFRGNINTSTIRTKLGRTIMVQHDCSSPRPYSRIHLVSGTKGAAMKYPLPPRISTGHEWLSDAEFAELEAEATPVLVKKMRSVAEKIGGHGGMDLLMDWRMIDCLRNGLPLDMTVYDAAMLSVIGPLSEWSVANGSQPIEVPDFTVGSWKTNIPQFDISFSKGGGSTVVRPVSTGP